MPLKVLISGGGTGGHIFPAIAIANEVKKLVPDAEILFVGAIGKMEMEKVPTAGYEIVGLNITGISRSLHPSNLSFPLKLLHSLMKARAIIKKFKPDVVVGVGGFASGPVLRMATWMKVPSLIQEQNSFAGLTNRWVGSAVNKVCVAYDGMERFFPKERIVKTGNPVREKMVQIEGKREAALSKLAFDPAAAVLLVVGGSLGARSINLALQAKVNELLDAGMQVIWQTGNLFQQEAEVLKEKFKNRPLRILPFIQEMDEAYAAADMVVSRAGAIAVSELCIVGKPVILVPFPFAAEDHQTKNAQSLVHTQAALMVADKDVQSRLVPEILRLFKDDALRSSLAANIRKHAMPHAATDIAKHIIALKK